MTISMICNLGSIVFGVGAWVFAIIAIAVPKARTAYRNSAFSFTLCLFSLVLQLFEVSNRVNIGDYAAIEDTIRAVLLAAVVLIAVTVALNITALWKARKK